MKISSGLLSLCLLVLFSPGLRAAKGSPPAVSITDTIHVIHYDIHIDTVDYSSKSINAHTSVTVMSKQNNISTVALSLLQLVVDSVTSSSGSHIFSYNDTTLRTVLASPLNQNDSVTITIYYHGNPKQDASGWGGFYFSGNYAFNMGVGFAAEPHNFGRVWYPCIDEFTDRSTYDFYVNTGPTYKAFCNGVLVSESLNPDGTKKWHWQLSETIPSYLAGIAIADFYSLERTSNGIPVSWACMASDTVKTLNTFANLDTVLSGFINAYGPYPFGKVGYVEIPFNSGAMEHATSIHIGKVFVDGSKSYETLWGHELSHMWWGDKVTCETASDMWLNEGFASYNEAFFSELVYGQTAYKDWIRSNHHKVLQFAHTPAQDGSYLAMNAIPSALTYGFTVYQKGADMVHTLRKYMGDSAFFAGCKYHLNTQAYANSNSFQLRDNLAASSGQTMNRFFDDWIFNPGFPHFSIDSVTEYIGAFNHYFIHTRQRSRGNSHLYEMPVEINLTDGVNDTTFTFVIDSVNNTFHVALLFSPTWISIDRNEKISDAIVDNEKPITSTGNVSIPETNLLLNVVNSGTNTSRIRVEHNYILPDGFKGWNMGIRISDYHYWKIDGLFDGPFLAKGVFSYNGSNSSSAGFLDHTLLTAGTVEDSLVMLYRAGTWDDWTLVNGYTLNKGGSAIDKIGNITVDTVKKGEYVLGIYDQSITGTFQVNSHPFEIKANPNPASGICRISFKTLGKKSLFIRITDSSGKQVLRSTIDPEKGFFDWNTAGLNNGSFVASVVENLQVLDSLKIIIAK